MADAHAPVDTAFTGSIPALYERYLVPLIFEPYAADLAARAQVLAPLELLEIAAGTGVVTRQLARLLPPACAIVATDLNPAMLEQAARVGVARPVQWRPADAMALPFADQAFDLAVCQFGAMFFPDRTAAFKEIRRVLRPGGALLFNVWDRIEDNEIILAIMEALDALYPDDPPTFMRRTPHGYHDKATIERDLQNAGFQRVDISTVAHVSQAATPHDAVAGYVQGSPMRGEIEPRGSGALAQAMEAATARVAARFGPGPVRGRIQAHVIVARP